MSISDPPVRLFLDSGVILQGCLIEWGAAKAGLILAATVRSQYTVVIADKVRRGIEHALDRIANTAARNAAKASYSGWLARATLEYCPVPSDQILRTYEPTILPILRHANDLPTAVAALLASPDWVLSTNTVHWTPKLEPILHTRVAHPAVFLQELAQRS